MMQPFLLICNLVSDLAHAALSTDPKYLC